MNISDLSLTRVPEALDPNKASSSSGRFDRDIWYQVDLTHLPDPDNIQRPREHVPLSNFAQAPVDVSFASLQMTGEWVSWGAHAPRKPRYRKTPTLTVTSSSEPPAHAFIRDQQNMSFQVFLSLPTSLTPTCPLPEQAEKEKEYLRHRQTPPDPVRESCLLPSSFPRHMIPIPWIQTFLGSLHSPFSPGSHDCRIWTLTPWGRDQLFLPTHHKAHKYDRHRYITGFLWTRVPDCPGQETS